ncbi:hypothetical protein [Bartonella vinsonii]|uniref:hypothetical protein n=1 Tax=Bartonella vinsonii TaxID=33047 RepID=UPI00034DC700|nr:hypothetical protein [Bartonella vinsonii]
MFLHKGQMVMGNGFTVIEGFGYSIRGRHREMGFCTLRKVHVWEQKKAFVLQILLLVFCCW